jgi:isopentenyldiphosphate isomerase
MHKSVSVWLKLIDGENKGKIILQRRAKDSKYFPYVYQPAWAGKVKTDEAIESAIKRECMEELGEKFFNNFNFSSITAIGEKKFIEGKNNWVSYNYFGEINSKQLKTIKIHKEAFSDFYFIESNDIFYPVSSEKNPQNNIVLFDDQCKVLKNLLHGN